MAFAKNLFSGGAKPAKKGGGPSSKDMKAVGRNLARANNQKKGKK